MASGATVEHECSVFIAGAGIAGAFLGALLRDDSVMVVDRLQPDVAPPAIATLWPDSLWLLDRIGVGQSLDSSGLPRILSVSFAQPQGDPVEGDVPYYLGRRHAIGPTRRSLVAALRGALESCPTRYLPATRMTGVEWSPRQRRWRVYLVHAGRASVVNTDIFVAACGRASSVAEQLRVTRYEIRPLRNRLRFQYARVPQGSSVSSTFRTFIGESAAVAHGFIQPADIGLVGVGIEGTRRDDRSQRFVDEVATIDALAEATAGLQWVGRSVEVPLGPMWKQRSESEQSLLIGDTGVYMDPVTGQGIGNALVSAVLASHAIAQHRAEAARWTDISHAFTDRRDRLTSLDFERAHDAADFGGQGAHVSSVDTRSRSQVLDVYTNRCFPNGRSRDLPILLKDALDSLPPDTAKAS